MLSSRFVLPTTAVNFERIIWTFDFNLRDEKPFRCGNQGHLRWWIRKILNSRPIFLDYASSNYSAKLTQTSMQSLKMADIDYWQSKDCLHRLRSETSRLQLEQRTALQEAGDSAIDQAKFSAYQKRKLQGKAAGRKWPPQRRCKSSMSKSKAKISSMNGLNVTDLMNDSSNN